MYCANYNSQRNVCLYLLDKFKDEKLAYKGPDSGRICMSSNNDWKECPYYMEQQKKIKSSKKTKTSKKSKTTNIKK